MLVHVLLCTYTHLFQSFVLLVSWLMKENWVDEELVGIGMTAWKSAGAGMTAGDLHFLYFFLISVLPISL